MRIGSGAFSLSPFFSHFLGRSPLKINKKAGSREMLRYKLCGRSDHILLEIPHLQLAFLHSVEMIDTEPLRPNTIRPCARQFGFP